MSMSEGKMTRGRGFIVGHKRRETTRKATNHEKKAIECPLIHG